MKKIRDGYTEETHAYHAIRENCAMLASVMNKVTSKLPENLRKANYNYFSVIPVSPSKINKL